MNSRARLAVSSALATLLSAAALGPVFDGMAWLLPAVGAIAVVTGVSELGRRVGAPLALLPVLAALAVTGYLTALFAGHQALAFVIPGTAAVRELRGEVVQGFADMRVLAPPVPTNSGMVLITVVGIAAVALVVDLLAVSLRQAALAGLPLLALFAVPAAVLPSGVGWLPFVLGGIGYLGLLLADGRDRLGRWGRPLGAGRAATAATPNAVEFAETSPLAAVGRRIGVAALGIAVAVPALIPGLHAGLFAGGGGDGLPTSAGSSTVTTYNPIARLKGYLEQKTPKELMRVRTTDPDPGYLRMTALDVFDGRTWSESALSLSKESRISKGRLPAPDGLTGVASERVQSTIKVRDLDVHWLPVPFPATHLKAKGWNYDRATATIFSTRGSTRRLSYTVVSRRVSPTSEQLKRAPEPDARLDAFKVLPELPPKITSQIESIVGDSTSAYAKAVAIQRFFRTGFKYDVSVPAGNSSNDLVNFLNGKVGYCEQFAAAMGIFARAAGIPARVAIGFTRGERQPDGSWKVTTADAHAWPELYFEGAGWLPFEPSPLGQGRANPRLYTQAPVFEGSDPGRSGGSSSPSDPAKIGVLGKLNRQLGDDVTLPPATPEAADRPSSGGPPLKVLLLGVLALALAVFPSLGRAVTRRRRWSDADTPARRAHAAWADLRDDAGDFGHGWLPSDSPRAAGARLIGRVGLTGAAADAVRLLVGAEERARYAPQPAETVNLRAAVAQVHSALGSRASRGRRWQARLVPLSGLRLAGVAAGAVGDALDRADLATARLRGRLLRRSPA